MIDDGLDELRRIVRRRGVVLVKCADYVSSGRLWPGEHHALAYALAQGFELLDCFVHVGRGTT